MHHLKQTKNDWDIHSRNQLQTKQNGEIWKTQRASRKKLHGPTKAQPRELEKATEEYLYLQNNKRK